VEFPRHACPNRISICFFPNIRIRYKKTFKGWFHKKDMEKTSWLQTKKVAAVFALTSFITGFLFLNKGITGNVILDNKYPFDIISFIGLMLVLCSAILVVYIIKK